MRPAILVAAASAVSVFARATRRMSCLGPCRQVIGEFVLQAVGEFCPARPVLQSPATLAGRETMGLKCRKINFKNAIWI